MPQAKKYIKPYTREKLLQVQKDIEVGIHLLKGRGGYSALDKPELQPAYDQLRHHLERALVWVEEMNWIIEREHL